MALQNINIHKDIVKEKILGVDDDEWNKLEEEYVPWLYYYEVHMIMNEVSIEQINCNKSIA